MTAETLGWRERLLIAALLLAVTLVFYAPILASGRLLAPGDGIAYYYPMRVLAAAALRSGELPFWNPFNFSGTPFLATLQPGVLFPGNLAFLLLPPVLAMNTTVVLTTWVSGLTAFAFARALMLPVAAALVTAITFMLSGFLLLNVQFLTIMQAAALMPLMGWAVARYRATAHPGYAAAGSGVLALQILAGHPQMVAYTMILVGALAVFLMRELPRDRWVGYGLTLAVMVGLGVGLSLVQILPSIDFIRDSQRQVITFEKLIFNTPTLLGLPGLLFPSFMGSRSPTAWMPHLLWPPDTWRFWLQGYTGMGAALLSLVALRRWRVRPETLFWAGAAVVSLVLALGGNTPVYRLWAWLPVVNQMPYPHRHLVVFTLAMAVLAGLGAAALIEGDRRVGRRAVEFSAAVVGTVCLAFTAVIAILGPGFAARTQPYQPPGIDLPAALSVTQPAFWLPWLTATGLAALLWALAGHSSGPRIAGLLLLMALDLGWVGYHNGYWLLSPMPPASVPVPDDGRHISFSESYFPYYRPIAEIEALAQPSLSSLQGVRSLHGYDAFIFQRYGESLQMTSAGHLGRPEEFWSADNHLRELLGLRWVHLDAALANRPEWRARLRPTEWRRTGEAAGVVTYRSTAERPNAWRVTTVSTASPKHTALRLTQGPRFDPRIEALIEETDVRPQAWSAGETRTQRLGMNRLRITSSGTGPGFVVVSESFDSGWRAFSQDQELPVYRVDGLVMGLAVPPGHNDVELRYEPRLWKTGLLCSTVTLILLVWFLVWRVRMPSPHDRLD